MLSHYIFLKVQQFLFSNYLDNSKKLNKYTWRNKFDVGPFEDDSPPICLWYCL